MFNKQLRNNIKTLDAQIGELSKELEGLRKDTKYDAKIRVLSDLTDLRVKLVKNADDAKSDIVIELDSQIEELAMMVRHLESDEIYNEKVKKLEDLTNIRCQLAEVKIKESHAPAIVSLIGGVGTILLVLKHEKADVITSKAFSIATKMFRG